MTSRAKLWRYFYSGRTSTIDLSDELAPFTTFSADLSASTTASAKDITYCDKCKVDIGGQVCMITKTCFFYF